MNRRDFLRGLMAAPVAAALPWAKIAAFIEPVAPRLSADISSIMSETLRKFAPQIVENIMANNTLLERLRDRGRIKG